MKVTRKDGKLFIEIDENTELLPSATGKTLIVASTHGNQPTNISIAGQVLRIGLNAYIPAAKGSNGVSK